MGQVPAQKPGPLHFWIMPKKKPASNAAKRSTATRKKTGRSGTRGRRTTTTTHDIYDDDNDMSIIRNDVENDRNKNTNKKKRKKTANKIRASTTTDDCDDSGMDDGDQDSENEQKSTNTASKKKVAKKKAKKDEVQYVAANMIPDGVDESYLGFDISGGKIINADGAVVIDYTPSFVGTAASRHKKFQNHGRYIVKNIGKSMGSAPLFSGYFGVNTERFGEQGNVMYKMWSPLLYYSRFADLRLALDNLVDYIQDEIQNRGMLDNNICTQNVLFQRFVLGFRQRLQDSGVESLLQCYDDGLMEMYGLPTIDGVVETINQNLASMADKAEQDDDDEETDEEMMQQ